jgi:cell wall-associated NlpC family hydrolase
VTVWNASRTANAATIVKVATDMGLGDQGATIGVMTAITESTLDNVGHGDGPGPSSRGLFQQMPSWGPLAVRMSPAGAAGLFFDRMVQIDNWRTRDPWLVAQKVQGSQFANGSNYLANLADAQALIAVLGHGDLSGKVADDDTGATGGGNTAWRQYLPSPDGGRSPIFGGTPTAPDPQDADAAKLAALPKLGDLPAVKVLPFTGAPVVDKLNRLGKMLLRGATAHADVQAATISAQMSYSSTQVNQFTIVLQDTPDAALMRAGLVKMGVSLDYADQHCYVRGISTADGQGGPQITLKGRSRVVARLKAQKGPGNWGSLTPAAWLRARAKEVGAAVICGPFNVAQTIARQADGTTPESTWDVAMRLAQQLGAICFEYDQVIVFGKPTWLAKRPYHTRWDIRWTAWDNYSSNIDGAPKFTGSEDSSDALSFSLVGDYSENCRPGDVVTLKGNLLAANGDWFVTGVDIPYQLGKPVAVTCARIVDPVPPSSTSTEPPPVAGGSIEGGDEAGRGAAEYALSKLGGPYVYAANGPVAFDCSGLTCQAWKSQGYTIARTSMEQSHLPAVALSALQPGDLVTYYSPVSHVAMYIGSGEVVSAADEAQGIIKVPVLKGGDPPVTGHRVPRQAPVPPGQGAGGRGPATQ